MTASRRKQLERLLLAEREQVQQTLSRLQTVSRDAQGDVGRFADDATASSSGASSDDDRALSAHSLRELEVIDQALAELRDDAGQFGLCHTCGKPIPLERLRLVPGTRHCRIHAPL